MKAKKIVSLLLVAAMTVSMAACGGNNQTSASKNNSNSAAGDAAGEDATESGVSEETSADEAEDLADIIPEETVTLDVFDQLANYSGEQIGWFGQIMLDKFNVKLNIIPVPTVYMRLVWSQETLEILFSGEMILMSISRQSARECSLTGTRMIS